MYPIVRIGFLLVVIFIVKLKKNYRKNNNVECFESLKFFKTSYQGFGPVCTLAKLSALYAIVAGLDTNHSHAAIAFLFELSAMMFLATDNAQILVWPHCYFVD